MYHVLEVISFVRSNFSLSHARCRELLPEDNFSESSSRSPHEVLVKLNDVFKVI